MSTEHVPDHEVNRSAVRSRRLRALCSKERACSAVMRSFGLPFAHFRHRTSRNQKTGAYDINVSRRHIDQHCTSTNGEPSKSAVLLTADT